MLFSNDMFLKFGFDGEVRSWPYSRVKWRGINRFHWNSHKLYWVFQLFEKMRFVYGRHRLKALLKRQLSLGREFLIDAKKSVSPGAITELDNRIDNLALGLKKG